VATKYILAVVGMAFLVIGSARLLREGSHPQGRTWLLVGIIFTAVSAFLFYQE
jgi:hypothetical protein